MPQTVHVYPNNDLIEHDTDADVTVDVCGDLPALPGEAGE